MKITKQQLKQIINEELNINEGFAEFFGQGDKKTVKRMEQELQNLLKDEPTTPEELEQKMKMYVGIKAAYDQGVSDPKREDYWYPLKGAIKRMETVIEPGGKDMAGNPLPGNEWTRSVASAQNVRDQAAYVKKLDQQLQKQLRTHQQQLSQDLALNKAKSDKAGAQLAARDKGDAESRQAAALAKKKEVDREARQALQARAAEDRQIARRVARTKKAKPWLEMKITKSQLKDIIKEELEQVLGEISKCPPGQTWEADELGEGQCVDLNEEEKKDDDFLGDVKSTGEWTDYTIAQLQKKKDTLMKKEKRTADEVTTVRQLNFAINAKQGDYKKKD